MRGSHQGRAPTLILGVHISSSLQQQPETILTVTPGGVHQGRGLGVWMGPVCRSTGPKQLRHDFHSAKRRRRDQGCGTIFIMCFEIGPTSNDFGHDFFITEHRCKMERSLLLFIPTFKRGRIEQSFSHPFKAAHLDRFEYTGHVFDHFANFLCSGAPAKRT